MVVHKLPMERELTPGVFVGSYSSLLDQEFFDRANIKVIVNCGSSMKFLEFLDLQMPIISSDVVVLNLDLSLPTGLAIFNEIHERFNKVLQHYLSFFYQHNTNIHYFINSNLNNAELKFSSPTINGNPLKLLFNINRLLKLMTNINRSAGVIFLSYNFDHQSPSNSLLYTLALLFLMDKYNLNLEASIKYLKSLVIPQSEISETRLFNNKHYDDVLLVDSLKKFFSENQNIKRNESGILTENYNLKRSCEYAETFPTSSSLKRLA